MEIPQTRPTLLVSLHNDAGKEQAWTVFDAAYREVVLGWCRRQLSDELAEDVTQDIMLKLFAELSRHEHDPQRGRFRSWLKTVVMNAVRDVCRKQWRLPVPAAQGGTKFGEWIEQWPDSSEELFEEVAAKTNVVASEVVRRVRERVSDQSWGVFCAMAEEERPAAAVAQNYGLSVAAVYKIKFRVTKALREEYQRVAGCSHLP
jgi:RNA polymerase sigma-70 factor (ECF subfamily)